MSKGNRRRIALLTCLTTDLIFGDPPNRFHPVAWMGNLISQGKKWGTNPSPTQQLITGAGITLFGSALIGGLSRGMVKFLSALPPLLTGVAEGILLKSTLTFRGLYQAAGEVEKALSENNLPEARKLLSFHLVSRDTTRLQPSQAAAAAIESVAENSSDGLVAPLFYYLIGGLPAAFIYRYINTADAMLGYKDPLHFWLGKIPARADDLANLLPSRITGLIISLSSYLLGDQNLRALRVMNRDASRTDSPNAGYPMAAMAGAAGVKLEKVGQYQLGGEFRDPDHGDLLRARRIFTLTSMIAVGLCLVFGWGPKGKNRKDSSRGKNKPDKD